jgi:arylsulfatase A-like enzyme
MPLSRNTTRRTFLRTIGAASLAAGPLAARAWGADAAPVKRPNILFLFADDQRFSTIHALGCDQIITPNLDSLARRGAGFTQACIMGGNNGAICIPSRAMLMTGRSLFRLRAPSGIAADDLTLPQHLKNNGYTTYITGKWHNDKQSLARSFSGGQNIFLGGMTDQSQVKVHDFDPTARFPENNSRTGEKFSTELFADSAISFLRRPQTDNPFFLYVPFTSPHDPRTAPRQYQDMYDPAKIAVPPNFLPEHPFDNGELKVRDELLAPFPRTPQIIQQHIADYYAMISHLDAQIGRILQTLQETGQAGNTLIVFAGDNGLALGQHGLMGKQSVYEHSVRVPLILAGPGIAPGVQSDAFCYLIDLYPSLCQMCNLPVPAHADGKSLLPTLRGEKQIVRDSLLFAYKDFQRAYRTREHKLIEYSVKNVRHTQLFNIAADPWETRNLADDPAHADTLQRLRRDLRRSQSEWGDTLSLFPA